LYLGIIHAFNCHYSRKLILNIAQVTWGTAPRCCIDEVGCIVCNSLNSRTLESENTYYNKNGFIKCGFLIGNISNNDNSSVKLSEDKRMISTVYNLFECSLRLHTM
jgi:hypothetical protein